ncbi:crossover junction endodeoxyribonuclease RuvC [Bacillus wiedmannii]|uniref:crossover junction endodeoxyribonuclease RuvC n=1 Tax=Bacillus wiedmannii TaxID=1890302 RepID=UPI000BF040FD|nr:crossover junction endodeoxyribonuclease RuvC [Bacillus wiedmannii]PEM08524.1 crossover junction endodeoxyribonuclease RuvC [Bacillus wiedmannii]
MIALGMDLSLSSPAFCVADITDGRIKVLHLSHVKTTSRDSHGKRLMKIGNHLRAILKKYPIDEVIREKGFSRHATTTQALFKVVGISDIVVFSAIGYENIHEIPPTTIKRVLTGSGKASKEEVAAAVLNHIPGIEFVNDDESDAAGVVITYAIQKKLLT